MQIFDVIIFFELRSVQQKTVKPTYLCPLGARKLAEGKGHETAETSTGEGRQSADDRVEHKSISLPYTLETEELTSTVFANTYQIVSFSLLTADEFRPKFGSAIC